MRRRLALLALLAWAHPAAALAPYTTHGECAGFPRLDLRSLPGTCVGLVAQHLGFARGIAVRGADIYVADMGGWAPDRGRLLHFSAFGHHGPDILLDHLDEPCALAFGPDGALYLGLRGRIVRVALGPHPSLTDAVTDLPRTGRHPLTAFAFAGDFIYINAGSATDHCEGPGGTPPDPAAICPETREVPPRAALLMLRLAPGAVSARSATVLATGLRNSEGLAVLPGGRLAAAVNARDYIGLADPSLDDEREPHDTLTIIRPGADYGWPYCFDAGRPSPEYPAWNCAAKQAPDILLPAHAAPLTLLPYQGRAIPALAGTLLIPFHGYREYGHRLMALPLSATGPLAGPLTDIIWGWDRAPGHHPQGNPVALAELPDGSLLITEDHNGTLLRLAPDR